jgi:hypothetical protein
VVDHGLPQRCEPGPTWPPGTPGGEEFPYSVKRAEDLCAIGSQTPSTCVHLFVLTRTLCAAGPLRPITCRTTLEHALHHRGLRGECHRAWGTVAACLLRICMQSAAANGKAFSAVFQSDDLAPGMQRTLVILVSISLGHVPALCSYGDQLVRWRH